MDATMNWPELVGHPGERDHLVLMYQDLEFLTDAVTAYIGTGLRLGEPAILIATPAHRAAFLAKLDGEEAIRQGQLKLLDAGEMLARVMTNGMPGWRDFHEIVGGAIAELRLRYRAVRAYGEMVDVLWQNGQHEAALRLEEYWNELGRLQSFPLLCVYSMDHLDPNAYGGPLESVCKAHTHLIPVRDYARFDQAVNEAAKKVLDGPLAKILLALSANHPPATHMPPGQAALLWLRQNMPRTADKVLQEVRASCAGSA